MSENILEGNHVVLMKSFDSDNLKVVCAERDTTVHYGKLHFDPSPLIGAKFGSVFQIKDKTMVEISDFKQFNENLSNTVSSSSATFSEKSQFSKEKLINKRKRQNHSNVVTLIRPNVVLINEMLYARDKLGGFRQDLLALTIQLSNIQNGSRCLVLDHNLGILTGAIMSRVLPDGICIQLLQDIEAVVTTRKTLSMLNITESDYKDKLLGITVRDLAKIDLGLGNTFSDYNEILKAKNEEHQARLKELVNTHHSTRDPESGTKTADVQEHEKQQQNLMKKDLNREQRHQERTKAITYLNAKLDSLILFAQHDHPLTLLKLCFQFLGLSRQFLIYSDNLDPLLECVQYLKLNSIAVSLNIYNPWFRKYQVLPDRTRPEMNVSGYGGYLLSGIKVKV